MSQNVVVIDYGMGNLGSISNMLKKLGINSVISSSKEVISAADKLILPGVGSFDSGIRNIDALGLRTLLVDQVVVNKKNILGICLGMQLFAKSSEEGELSGLGFIDAVTVKFKFIGNTLKIPHMGWNSVNPIASNTLFPDSPDGFRFYFVHSYHLLCNNQADITATANYGYDFPCAINHGNVYGVQFHPEKSHHFGMNVLKNFVNIPC